MKLYDELSEWWPLLSPPEEYAEEASLYLEIISRYKNDIKTVLELGCGGGGNAFYFKKHFQMTLTDISEGMLKNSKKINPECEHTIGDMRNLKLNKVFDLVFLQDAVMHMITKGDLKRVFKTANKHLNEDGLFFIAPDWYKETFKPTTECGGHDGKGRSMRYLDWEYYNKENENIVDNDFIYILKEEGKKTRVIHEEVKGGIFSQNTWKELLEDAGFNVTFETINHSKIEPGKYIGIVCTKKRINNGE